MNFPEVLYDKFKQLFNEEPLLVRSPGRVNLIGEHTDYNNGYVLPAAIDKAVYFALSKRNDNRGMLYAADLNDSYEFNVNEPAKSGKAWANYLIGVVAQLKQNGYEAGGFNCLFGGDIPIGAGLSSSAAIEAGLAFALNTMFNLNVEKIDLVKYAQKAEHEYAGVNCGIMDQFINIFGMAGNVLRIDCRSLEYEYFPFDFSNISIVLFNTKVSHSLASSEYNQRRRECGAGVEILKELYPEVESLRDVTVEMLETINDKVSQTVYSRCQYVVEEHDRIIEACRLLKGNDLKAFGRLMYETHQGLSNLYGVSCSELDFLVEAVKDIPEVYGSRMMGGGFGGCTINLIETGAVEKISSEVKEKYKNKFGMEADVYVTKISAGTGVVEK